MLAVNEKLTGALPYLEQSDMLLYEVEQGLIRKMNESKAMELIRPYRASIRNGDFGRAKDLASQMGKAKLTTGKIGKKAKEFVQTIETMKDLLVDKEGRYYYKSSEVRTVMKSYEADIKKKTDFINKYYLAFLENSHKTLGRLREKLSVVGSLENLMTLYIRLMRGAAEPIVDFKSIREYETQVIENIDYIMGNQFSELEVVDQRITEAMDEFWTVVNDFHAYEDSMKAGEIL